MFYLHKVHLALNQFMDNYEMADFTACGHRGMKESMYGFVSVKNRSNMIYLL